MTESITRIRGTGLPGSSPFGIMLTLLQIRLSSLLYLLLWTRSFFHLFPFHPIFAASLLFLQTSLQTFSNSHTHTHTNARARAVTHTDTPTLVLLFYPLLDLCRASSPAISFLPPLVEHPPRTQSILTCGLLCNQNNNNCFGTFDYSSIRVTADCLQLCVAIARLAIRG